MRLNRGDKVEYDADTRRHSEGRPLDAKNQAQCPGKLTSGQKRKVRQRHADDFVHHPHLTRVATNLTEAENTIMLEREW
jgi:hypothetical protein